MSCLAYSSIISWIKIMYQVKDWVIWLAFIHIPALYAAKATIIMLTTMRATLGSNSSSDSLHLILGNLS